MINESIFKLLWNLFAPILNSTIPSASAKGGRPRRDLKVVFFGCLYMLKSGGVWRTLPVQYGPFSTCHQYFLKWSRAGLFELLWEVVRKVTFFFKGFDQKIETIDASERHSKNMYRDLCGFGHKIKGKRAVKISILSDRNGKPLGIDVGKASSHDVTRFKFAFRDGHRLLRSSNSIILGDAGYIGDEPIEECKKYYFKVITVKRRNQTVQNTSRENKLLKDYRWKAEPVFSRLYSFARVERCLDRTGEAFKSWCFLAVCSMLSSF